MPEIRFYHLQRATLDQALPQLLERVLDQGRRAVVVAGSPERVEALNQLLWTYRPDSFLPHGSRADGFAPRQPVWLTDSEENPNGADVLVLTDGMSAAEPAGFATICDLFDGNDPQAVAEARARWRDCKAAGHALTYWQQSERGGWERKA
jgi:DNA polymerase-3 subunit chi